MDVFGRTQGDERVHFGFAFPIANSVQPELLEFQRAGEFAAGKLNHVGIIREIIQILSDVIGMKRAANRIAHVIKLRRDDDAFLNFKWRLMKPRVVDVVLLAPWAIHPMCPIFKDVVLEIIFVEKHEAPSVANICKLFQSQPIPGVELRQIVFA